MYSNLPKGDRILMRATLAAGWGFTALSGVGGAWFTGKTVAAAEGPAWVIPAAGIATLAASLIAIVGVVAAGKLWWLEWVGAGIAGAGITYYALIPWQYLLAGESGRLQQASLVAAALIGFVTHRIIACLVHARKLARDHATNEALRGHGG